MNVSSFTQLSVRVSRLALLALAVSVAGVGQANEQWHVYDVLGNTVASVNADAMVAEIESTAFGESRTPTAGARFTGKPYDADLGAHVFPFRNYRGDSGRWTSADPSGFPDGTNASSYAPNPLIHVDPYGLYRDIVETVSTQRWTTTVNTVTAGIAAVGAGGVTAVTGGSAFAISAAAVGAGGTSLFIDLAASSPSYIHSTNIYDDITDGFVLTGSSPGVDDWSVEIDWGVFSSTITLTNISSTIFNYGPLE